MKYVLSCGWLILPVFVWNLVLTRHLPRAFQPDVFWHDIPPVLGGAENTLRLTVSILPFLMPLPSGRLPILGVGLYGVGLAVYGASWMALVWWPNSAWSQGVLGFTAPAYTAIFWLLGIALVGRQLYLNIPYRWWVYVILSTLFTGVHVAHAVLVFNRMARQ